VASCGRPLQRPNLAKCVVASCGELWWSRKLAKWVVVIVVRLWCHNSDFWNLWASCGGLWRVVASCGGLWQVVGAQESTGKVEYVAPDLVAGAQFGTSGRGLSREFKPAGTASNSGQAVNLMR